MSKVIEIKASFDQGRMDDTWGAHAFAVMVMTTEVLTGMYPDAKVSVHLSGGYRTDALMDGGFIDPRDLVEIDSNVDHAYEIAAEKARTWGWALS